MKIFLLSFLKNKLQAKFKLDFFFMLGKLKQAISTKDTATEFSTLFSFYFKPLFEFNGQN